MKINLIWIKNSIFKRLIITFLAIIVPLYLIGTGIYRWAIDTVKSEITNSAMSQVSFYLENLQKDIERIRFLQLNLLMDEDLEQLTYVPDSLDDIEKMKAILRLEQRLLSIKNSSPYIKNVGMHIQSIGKTIYAEGGVYNFDKERFNLLQTYMENSTCPIIVLPQNQIVTSVKKPTLPLNQREYSKAIIEVQMFNMKLRDELIKFKNYEDSGLVMMDLGGAYSLSTAPDDEINRHLEAYMLEGNVNSSQKFLTVIAGKKRYISVYSLSEKLNIVLYKYISENQIFEKTNKYIVLFWLFTLSAGVMIFLFAFSTYKFIKKPLNKLILSFKQVEEGDFNIRIKHKNDDEFKQLYQGFNLMVDKIKQLLEQIYMQKILKQRAELKQLQSQINPHFLYNSFFILYNMVDYDDSENVKKFAKQLGNYFQFITRSSADDVPLSQEVKHARTYAEIQAKRFRNRIRLNFEDLPDAYENVIVPRLIIQPVIENAFEHGLENKMENGIVNINFSMSHAFLSICIEDNGDGMTDEVLNELRENLSGSTEEIECTGIINIHRRIQLRFGLDSGVIVSRGELGGLKVLINIYLKEE